MSKKSKLKKTLVEKILDKAKVDYKQFAFETHMQGDVAQLDVNHGEVDEHRVYKTLVLSGKTTGPVVGVVPLDKHLNEKELARVSGNKKVNMVPLRDLEKTTGYEHGANTPIGIWEKFEYPIYIDASAEQQGSILVSSGKIGRSVEINATDLKNLVHAEFADIATDD
ncbi:Cys-tRNA(Pro) deacylase [Lactobacillus sp. Sy-1]|uniref:Cys-tRNA(Pro) deacylase n=1 Tax=Lactobacillus sp. Sy-1 TaxID=2109645 RepID=UPI001C599ED0|nr:Cys-tRNA(Pro) deacylase [Lactobacillus sp. Sy-1]MBW1604905.1 Cys-tRNA(Pro) deacylase [Lactobacillus sp. Sy-1]